jgi:hypothetical protein
MMQLKHLFHWTSFDCKGEKIRMVDGWPTIIFWLADMSWNF